jgi:hypothetical protein
MELIDDWGALERVAAGQMVEGKSQGKGKALPVGTPEAIEAELAGFEPAIITVHCYEDVGYPWVMVVFDTMIAPSVALKVGEALARVAGAQNVYLNSLRPKAVYFLLEPAFAPRPDLLISRYGALLKDVEDCWTREQG